MPVVQRHNAVEGWIYDAARKHLTRKREGIHVSDLVMPRKAYFGEAVPKPPTNRELGYFLAGRAHEDAVAGVSGLGHHRKIRGEWEGISYEIDSLVIDERGMEVPTEFKTNRRPTILEPEEVAVEYELAIAQLGCYVVVQALRTAYLIQFHLMARNLAPDGETAGDEEWVRQSEPKIVVYQIDWSEAELDAIRDWMRRRRDTLILAKQLGDHTLLPECPNWACGKEFIRKFDPRCPRCGRVYTVGEEKEDGTKSGVKKKCDDCKDGRVKVDLVRDQETMFVPTCRWFFDCRPGQWAQYLDRSVDTGQEGVLSSAKP